MVIKGKQSQSPHRKKEVSKQLLPVTLTGDMEETQSLLLTVHGQCQGSAAQLPVLVAGEAAKHAGDHKKIQVAFNKKHHLSQLPMSSYVSKTAINPSGEHTEG